MVAARVAAQLRKDGHIVELKHGGFGELRVSAGAVDLYDGSRLGYALPGSIVKTARARLAEMQARDPGGHDG
jgi:hypothetical protein